MINTPGTPWVFHTPDPLEHCGRCRRRGAKPVAVRIAVEAEHVLPRFVLAPPLATLLGFEHDTREGITRAMWTYIRMHRLQVGPPPAPVPLR